MFVAFRLLLSFFMVIATTYAQCQLSQDEIIASNRIFLTVSGGNYELMRTNVVPAGGAMYMLCNSQNIVRVACQGNTFQWPTPQPTCSKLLKANVKIINSFGSCPHTLYSVGYELDPQHFLEIYRSCYDDDTSTASYTIHTTYPHTLPCIRVNYFKSHRIGSAGVGNSYQNSAIYRRFLNSFDASVTQKYYPTSDALTFHRGHLTGCADLGFAPYIRESFATINTVPMLAGVNIGNWKRIEDWVRIQVGNNGANPLQICTGGLGILKESSQGRLQPVYLYRSNRGDLGNAVPKWLFKIVYGANIRIAFLTINNDKDQRRPNPNCSPVQCPLTFNPSYDKGFSFCCDADLFIASHANYLRGVC